MADLLFSAENMGKRFGGNTVLKSASLWVHKDRITALLGRNGCGKTTLLKCAVGELRRDHGVIRYLGNVLERPRLWRLSRQGLRYVDQEARLPIGRTLGQLFRLIARRSGTDETGWVKRLQLVEFLEARSPQLSRGERKRAALAAALIANPACLILDEPFESVAPKDKDLLTQCLRTVVGQGQGVLITGHDTGAMLEAATHVTWCVAGTTHDLGSVTEALDTPQFVREYLGPGFSAS